MGCFASKPAVHHDEPPAPPSAPMAQRARSSTTVPTPPPSASVPSTPTLSRPRSRTPSLRQPTHTEGSSSTSRTRTRSMPQNLERSSSQDRRRARTLTPGERHDSVPRMPNPGERVMLGWAMNLNNRLISAPKGGYPITCFNDAASALQSSQVCGSTPAFK